MTDFHALYSNTRSESTDITSVQIVRPDLLVVAKVCLLTPF